MRRRTFFATIAFVLAAPAAFSQVPARIRGAISAYQDHALAVETSGGQTVTVALAPEFAVSAIVPADLGAVKPGRMIGIVGFGPPERQRASVVTLFMPGATIAEAQFPWDSAPDSVMTNAPVVSDVQVADGRTLTVTVKGKPIQIEVSPRTIIQSIEPGTPAMLVPGAHVLIIAQKAAAGTYSASRVNVGKDGFIPAN